MSTFKVFPIHTHLDRALNLEGPALGDLIETPWLDVAPLRIEGRQPTTFYVRRISGTELAQHCSERSEGENMRAAFLLGVRRVETASGVLEPKPEELPPGAPMARGAWLDRASDALGFDNVVAASLAVLRIARRPLAEVPPAQAEVSPAK